MLDPLSILLVGGGVLAFRELNKKDYGVLTPSRDERYRNVMEHCHDPEMLLRESQLFADHGLKAQAAMLRRRAEWRARPQTLKDAHEAVYQKAIKSMNIAGILEVASAFEGWTATKKAATLRERATKLQEEMLQEAAKKAADSVTQALKEEKEKGHVNGTANIPQNIEPSEAKAEVVSDDI